MKLIIFIMDPDDLLLLFSGFRLKHEWKMEYHGFLV